MPHLTYSRRQALQLLDSIVKHGAERVVDDARDHLFRIRLLTDFQFHDEGGEDKGVVGTCTLDNAKILSIQIILQFVRKPKPLWLC